MGGGASVESESVSASAVGLMHENSLYKDNLIQRWSATGQNTGIDLDKPQPSLQEEIIGANFRSKISGLQRMNPYQVVLSFPGATFSGGEVVDADGLTMGSGHELAVEFHKWIATELGENGTELATQLIYFDYHNLQYVPATVACANYKNRGGTAFLNTNWNFYYVEAQLECTVMVVFCSREWIQSSWCMKEFDDLKELMAISPERFENREMAFIVVDKGVYEEANWPGFKAQADEMGVQFMDYTSDMSGDGKNQVEANLLKLFEEKCTMFPLQEGLTKIVESEVTWSDDSKVGGL